MKANIKEDIIINITTHGTTEIGKIPKGVGLERLRFDGTRVVDLMTLNQIWVRHEGNGFYSLHCIRVKNSQLVDMTYVERKNIVTVGGIIRIRTPQEELDHKQQLKKEMIENRLRARLKEEIGNRDKKILALFSMIAIVAYYARNGGPQAIEDWLDEILPNLANAFPFARVKDDLKVIGSKLKTELVNYYDELDGV